MPGKTSPQPKRSHDPETVQETEQSRWDLPLVPCEGYLPEETGEPNPLRLTHFAYWSCGVFLRTTPQRYAEEVREIEQLVGSPWLKGISRRYGHYEPIP